MKAYSLGRLFPRCTAEYYGPRTALIFLIIANVIGTTRSLVHIFAADSGAGSIAGMDVTAAGGANAVSLLAQWGGAQLLEALIIWVVVIRYRGLVPFMLLIVTLELTFRKFIGEAKPVVSAHTPPGATMNEILLPICLLAFLASLYVLRRFRSEDA